MDVEEPPEANLVQPLPKPPLLPSLQSHPNFFVMASLSLSNPLTRGLGGKRKVGPVEKDVSVGNSPQTCDILRMSHPLSLQPPFLL